LARGHHECFAPNAVRPMNCSLVCPNTSEKRTSFVSHVRPERTKPAGQDRAGGFTPRMLPLVYSAHDLDTVMAT